MRSLSHIPDHSSSRSLLLRTTSPVINRPLPAKNSSTIPPSRMPAFHCWCGRRIPAGTSNGRARRPWKVSSSAIGQPVCNWRKLSKSGLPPPRRHRRKPRRSAPVESLYQRSACFSPSPPLPIRSAKRLPGRGPMDPALFSGSAR